MMQQYHRAKAQYPDAILFFHLGDFYETFFEDAEIVARELDIALTQRDGHPMAGVPVRKADVYIQRLLKKGYKVALCDQLERPGPGKKLLKRGVVRVLTPGTVLEGEGLEVETDAFLLGFCREGGRVGLAWCEAASGEFWVTEVDEGELEGVISRLGIREVVVPKGTEIPPYVPGVRTVLSPEVFNPSPLVDLFGPLGLAEERPLAAKAAGAMARGLRAAVFSNKPHEFTKLCVARLLPRWAFAAVQGVSETNPPKPDPGGALAITEHLGVAPAEFLYVGDTNTDMKTAAAAGMFAVGVTWGFRSPEELLANGARALIDTPSELLGLLGRD